VLARRVDQRLEGLDRARPVAHRAAHEAQLLERLERRLDALALGEVRRELEHALELRGRLAVRVAPLVVLGRAQAVVHGAREVASALEVHGQLGRDLAHALAVQLLAAQPDALVQPRAARRRRAAVQDVRLQAVREGVARGEAAVGEATDPRGAQEEPAPREPVAVLLDARRLGLEPGGHGRGGEFRAGDRRGLEHALLVLGQTRDLELEHLADALRHLARQHLGVARELDAPAALAQHALRDQPVDDVHEEERMTLRAAVERARERRRQRMAGEARVEVTTDRFGIEVGEHDLAAQAARREIELDRAQLLAGMDVGRAAGEQEEQACRLAPPGEQRHEVERRGIAPVQVLEQEHERRLVRERLERLGHLAQHALARRAEQLAREALAPGGVAQRGQLHEPGGRVAREPGLDARSMGTAAEPAQRVEHGQIRLALAEGLEALAARDQSHAAALDLAQARLDERGLADSGRAAHEHDAALALQRPLVRGAELVELGAAADERAGALGCRSRRGRGRGFSAPRQLAQERIPAAVARLDPARRARVVAQRHAQLAHAHLEHAVGHRRAAPHLVEQLVLRHQAPGPLREVAQERIRTRGERDALGAEPQTLVDGVQARLRLLALPLHLAVSARRAGILTPSSPLAQERSAALAHPARPVSRTGTPTRSRRRIPPLLVEPSRSAPGRLHLPPKRAPRTTAIAMKHHSFPIVSLAARLAPVLPLVLASACSSGGGGGGSAANAVLAGPSRSTNVALTSDDRVLVVANRDADTATVLAVRDALGADAFRKWPRSPWVTSRAQSRSRRTTRRPSWPTRRAAPSR
jgi:hypothetical protein